MSNWCFHASSRYRSARGFSQIEVVASTFLMGVLFVASMTSIAASRTRAYSEMNRLQGLALANDLMTEILSLPACDPENGSSFIGLDSGESIGANRSGWDDVDDYQNLSETPPKSREGININGYAAWSRQTAVESLQSNNWTQTNTTFDRVYRVTIRVSRKGKLVATSVGFKNGDQLLNGPFQGP